MVTGFYAALASSASVFIGILTALLTSNLSNLQSEQAHIKRRVRSIDSRLENLDDQRDEFQETVENIRDHWNEQEQQEEAEEQVDQFIEQHVGEEFEIAPEDLNPEIIQREFRQFLGEGELSQYQEAALQERYEDIESQLETSPLGVGPIPNVTPDAEIIAMNRQIEAQWDVHTNQRFNRNYRQWIQTLTEMNALRDERQELVDRYSSLDPSRIRDSLKAGIVTILLSVGIPLATYLAHTLVSIETAFYWIEPLLVFVLWAIGLGYVFDHIRKQIGEETDELPEEPDVGIDESEVREES